MTKNMLEATSEPLARRVAAGLEKIGLSIKTQAWRDVGTKRMSPLQAQALAFLRRHQQSEAHLSMIAEGLGVSMPTASEALRTLHIKGMVRKDRVSIGDARVVKVSLTAKGQRQAEGAAGWPNFLAAAADQLSSEEQEGLLRVLIKIIRTLQARREISTARMCVTCRFFRANVHPDSEEPHHCDYFNAPFGDRLLRIDCAEHAPATKARADRMWKQFNSMGERR